MMLPMGSAFKVGDVIHGYRLIRVIGEGGFGRVWLCVSELLEKHFGLKEIRGVEEAGKRELKAVQKFKLLNLGSGSNIMPIEHVGRFNGLLYYVMPLADGDRDVDVKSADWQPRTLGLLIRKQRDQASWFSAKQIIAWLVPIIHAADVINKKGLAHRDIKPDNILFVGDKPVLSDISLLREDGASSTLTREIGTPGYRAPKWYIESSGNPDMYGLAVTLYVVLTGNDPDTLGKRAEKYWWPPQGKETLLPEDLVEWERLHKLILRATSDEESERFPDFEAFANAAYGTIVPQPITPREAGSSYSERSKRLVRKKIPAWARRRIIVGVAIVAFLLTSLSGFYINRLLRPAVVETIDGGLIKNPRTSGEFFYNARMLSERGEIQQAVDQYSKLFASGGMYADAVDGLVKLSAARGRRGNTELMVAVHRKNFLTVSNRGELDHNF